MISKIFSFLKSLYVSFRLCTFKDAIHIPIWVKWNTKLLSLKGRVAFPNGARFGMLQVGFSGVGIIDPRYQRSILEIDGIIKCMGAFFCIGSRICVLKSGVFEIGSNFQNSAQITIICSKQITLGDNVLTSWETLLMDTDFHHYIDENGQASVMEKPIQIGDNVWLGARVMVLKGTTIPRGCILAANSVGAGSSFKEEKCILGGNPCAVIKRGCELKR